MLSFFLFFHFRWFLVTCFHYLPIGCTEKKGRMERNLVWYCWGLNVVLFVETQLLRLYFIFSFPLTFFPWQHAPFMLDKNNNNHKGLKGISQTENRKNIKLGLLVLTFNSFLFFFFSICS